MIVVDTNVVAYLLLPGPQTSAAEALLEAEQAWSAQRRGAVSLDQAIALQHHAETLVITHEEPVHSEDVLHLVASSGCSAYDCESVAAAQQLGVPLITADQALLTAFPDLAQALPITPA